MEAASDKAIWPGAVIHVNEDGWVLINRGARDGVVPGLRLLVVGTAARELRDPYAQNVAAGDAAPVVLRIRRTFELLEVVHVESACAVAVAARVPAARRPECYTGPEGELLVWVPLPQDYTWPPVPDDDEDNAGDADEDEDDGEAGDDGAAREADAADGSTSNETADVPPGGGQDDQRWEEALPLNSVTVGDLVVPAIPAVPASPAASGAPDAAGKLADASARSGAGAADQTAHDEGTYDWMKLSADQ